LAGGEAVRVTVQNLVTHTEAAVRGVAEQLVCAECGRKADDEARGWHAFLIPPDEEEGEQAEVIFFCAVCTVVEFNREVR
jgi:hypothetical protein